MDRYEMPMGLSFQLGLNEKALTAYARLEEEEKKQVIEAARQVRSKAEMQRLVSGLEKDFTSPSGNGQEWMKMQ